MIPFAQPMLAGSGSFVPKPLLVVGDGYLPNDGKTYQLVFSDEFAGTTLDRTKWFTRYKDNSGTLNHYDSELERYNDNHVVSNGTLKMTATTNGQTYTAPTGKVYSLYGSQMIRSRTTFKYGFFQLRCKLPGGLGCWPAGWLLEAAVSSDAEIDNFERVLTGVNERYNMIHLGNDFGGKVLWSTPAYNKQYGFLTTGTTDVSASVHDITMLWDPTTITAWFDGQPVVVRQSPWQHNNNATLGPAGLASHILNLAMGGPWATNNWTTAVVTTPQTYEIYYVRVSQVAGQIITGTAPI